MCIFSTPKAQTVTPPPAVVDTTDTSNAAFVAASNSAKQKAALASGQGSTVLTSPLGDQTPATTQQKTLLGQ